MLLDRIEVDEKGVVRLVLFDGPTPTGMSTHELKKYAHDQFFGYAVEELGALIESSSRTNGEKLMAISRALSLR